MEKLLMLKDHLDENMQSNNVVHLELASIGSIDYMRNILNTVNMLKYVKNIEQKLKKIIFIRIFSV
jgi:hypothetical protein